MTIACSVKFPVGGEFPIVSADEGFRTAAARTSLVGRMSSVHTPATTGSTRRRWGMSPGAIEDQQLLLDEHGLGRDGTRAARPVEPDDGRQEVQKKDGQVAHGTVVTSDGIAEMLKN
jgi:hypothetical protein